MSHQESRQQEQDSSKDDEQFSNTEMADGGTNFKPTSIVSNKVEKVDSLNISDTHDSQEQSERLKVDARTEDTQYGRSNKERYQHLDDQ